MIGSRDFLVPEDVNPFLTHFPYNQDPCIDYTGDELTPVSDSSITLVGVVSGEKKVEVGENLSSPQFRNVPFLTFCITLGASINCIRTHIASHIKLTSHLSSHSEFSDSLKTCLSLLIDSCSLYIEANPHYNYRLKHFREKMRSIVQIIDEGSTLFEIQQNLEKLHEEIELLNKKGKDQGLLTPPNLGCSPFTMKKFVGRPSEAPCASPTSSALPVIVKRASFDLPNIDAPQKLPATPVSRDSKEELCRVKISEIVEGALTANVKQSYFLAFLTNVQSKIEQLLDNYALQLSLTRIISYTKDQSSLLDLHAQQLVSSLIHMCEEYLRMPVVPFFFEVTQLKMKLLNVQNEISEKRTSNLDNELKDLQACALNHLGAPWAEQSLDGAQVSVSVGRSGEDKRVFLNLLKAHLERLNNFYDSYKKLKEESLFERRGFFAILIYNTFVQLIMECDEYLSACSGNPFSQYVCLFKEKLDNAWLHLTNLGDMKEDLKALQSIIQTALSNLNGNVSYIRPGLAKK